MHIKKKKKPSKEYAIEVHLFSLKYKVSHSKLNLSCLNSLLTNFSIYLSPFMRNMMASRFTAIIILVQAILSQTFHISERDKQYRMQSVDKITVRNITKFLLYLNTFTKIRTRVAWSLNRSTINYILIQIIFKWAHLESVIKKKLEKYSSK